MTSVDEIGSDGSKDFGGRGNTKLSPRAVGTTSGGPKRITAAKKWVFTLNNYSTEDEAVFGSDGSAGSMVHNFEVWAVGREVAPSTGTPHLQGYIEFKKKCRPAESYFDKRAHWEKAKGDRTSNVVYCTKEGNVLACSERYRKPVKVINVLRPWQQMVDDIVVSEPDDRTIHWFWEPEGNFGKSALCKYLAVKRGAMILAGKIGDVHHAICSRMEKDKTWEPTTVIMDIPRVSHGGVSYAGIEKVKDGHFYSPKYEGGECLFNSPHVIVFANEPPVEDKMSADRWHIVNLREFTKEAEKAYNPFDDIEDEEE